MSDPTTLRALTGLPTQPAALGQSVLVMIDCQNTYTRGTLALDGVEGALEEAEALLGSARRAGTPVVHIQHDAGPGSPYDVTAEIGRIVDRVAPREGEPVVVKNYPNSFVDTDLQAHLRRIDRTDLVFAGFMTHMCVNSTARAAFNLGYAGTVVAAATATRDLPLGGRVVDAPSLQAASLAAVEDMFAIVVPDHRALD